MTPKALSARDNTLFSHKERCINRGTKTKKKSVGTIERNFFVRCKIREACIRAPATRAEPSHLKEISLSLSLSLSLSFSSPPYAMYPFRVTLKRTKERREKEERRESERLQRKRDKEEKEGRRARNSAKVEKKRGRGISEVESSVELHTEELENALFRLHSHRLRWVCREREIPAKWLRRVSLAACTSKCSSRAADSSGPSLYLWERERKKERERERERGGGAYLIYRPTGDATLSAESIPLWSHSSKAHFRLAHLSVVDRRSDNRSHFYIELNIFLRNTSELNVSRLLLRTRNATCKMNSLEKSFPNVKM